jgi:general secretion pathway protein K
VALVALIGARVLMIQGMSVNQSLARDDYDTARETASAGLHWARAILYDDGRRSSIDHLGEAWAQSMPPTVVGDTTVSGFIEDAQGRFNLNSLVGNGKTDPIALAVFSRMLANLGLAPGLAESAADWMDADDELISQNSAETDYYMSLRPPYRPSSLPFGSIEELLRVRGFSPSIIERLRRFVIVLPTPVPVNVNTASPELLSAIVPGLSLDSARSIALERQRSPFKSTVEFLDRMPGARSEKLPSLDVQSKFFLVSGSASQANTHYQVAALLQRQEARWPRIVWQMPQ